MKTQKATTDQKANNPPNLVDLLQEVYDNPRGCKVALITDPKALQFIGAVARDKSMGKQPNITRAAELLYEYWGIKIKRRALSAHIRGECTCLTK